MFAVIDGATAKGTKTFEGMSSGKYASTILEQALRAIPDDIAGAELVAFLSERFKRSLIEGGYTDQAETTSQHCPNAKFACVQVSDTSVYITRVGDVGVRVNGERVLLDTNPIDPIHAKLRIEAIQNACIDNPEVSLEEALIIGRKAIETSLIMQTLAFQNNQTHPFGFGAIDGKKVPEKFISYNVYSLEQIESIELFSDGYFKIPEKPTIASWEEAFDEVEQEDPYKIHTYPSTKGSSKSSFTDDRTILIAKRTATRNKGL